MPNSNMYPTSYLWTMVTELLRELKLDDKYSVLDVKAFGYNPWEDQPPSVWIEVFTRDASGQKTGTEVITRWVYQDIPYSQWGNPPSEPVVS